VSASFDKHNMTQLVGNSRDNGGHLILKENQVKQHRKHSVQQGLDPQQRMHLAQDRHVSKNSRK